MQTTQPEVNAPDIGAGREIPSFFPHFSKGDQSMNHLTRRNVLQTTGFTLCSALFGGMSGNAMGKEPATPSPDSNLERPAVAPGESRAALVNWYKRQQGATGSQTLLAAYGDLFGISEEMAMKVASGFSGGLGHTGEVCGMVTAAIMLLGLKNGPNTAERGENYKRSVELADQFSKDYRARHQSVVCRELIQFDISTPELYARAHEIEGIWDVCREGLKTIVDLLENKYGILDRHKENP